MKYKYVNGIQCPLCSQKIWSKYRHDFRHCSCGYCFVDGGRSYTRTGYGGDKFPEPWIVPKSVRIRVSLDEYDIDSRYEKVTGWPY